MSLGAGLSPKHIVEVYGGLSWSMALHELYRKACEFPVYRPEHEDHIALYMFLGHLENVITLIHDAQNTGQLFCAGVYADYFVAIRVEIDGLWPYVTTLLNCFADCSGIELAAIAVYTWLVKPSRFRMLLKLLARGHPAFYVAIHNYKMMRDHISMYNITEGEFVENIVHVVSRERLSKLTKIGRMRRDFRVAP